MQMSFVDLLKNEFSERQRRNRSYSLRAFAKTLDVDQSLLSKILKGQRAASRQVILKASQRLGLDSVQTEGFLASKENHSNQYNDVQFHAAALCGYYEHWAILELFKTKKFRCDVDWIAKRLGLAPVQVDTALARLEYFDLIDRSTTPWRLLKANNSWTSWATTGPAKKSLQKNLLEKAAIALDEVPLEQRENASLTVACSPQQLNEVKRRIDRCIDDIDRILEKSGPHDEVYQLVIGFYPLTQGERK